MVNERIHDDEPDTSEPVVRTLLAAECPQWADAPIEYLKTSGTDNAMWRIRCQDGAHVVMRLPRRAGAAAGVEREMAALQAVEHAGLGGRVKTPSVRHIGSPHDVFPHRWSILGWIDGVDAWAARNDLGIRSLDRLASDLGQVVRAIGELPAAGVRRRRPGSRGGALLPLLEQLGEWLADPRWNAASLVDVDAVQRLAAQAREVVDEPVHQGVVHGDLIPGNLLVDNGRLTAIIDWGGVGHGDTAQDLAPAWSVLTAAERPLFRELVGADDAAWIRGRAFELEHAVGGVLYYKPRRHPLGDVMARTLDRILASRLDA